MDSSNLGVVFAPTILRSTTTDHGTMLAEMGYSKTIVTHLIDSFAAYFPPIVLPSDFLPSTDDKSENGTGDAYERQSIYEEISNVSNALLSGEMTDEDKDVKLAAAMEQIGISICPAMLERFNRTTPRNSMRHGSIEPSNDTQPVVAPRPVPISKALSALLASIDDDEEEGTSNG